MVNCKQITLYSLLIIFFGVQVHSKLNSFLLKTQSMSRKPVHLEPRHRRDTNEEHIQPVAKKLDIIGRISSRFAETTVTSVMENVDSNDHEAEFELQIPETAFISSFVMTINGEKYTADVKEKAQAQQQYDEAKVQNKTAGQISSRPRNQQTAERGMEIFAVHVNVAKESIVEFELTYQNALEAVNGVFTYILSIRPQQVVQKLTTQVYLYEPQGFRFVEYRLPGEREWKEVYNHDRSIPMQTYAVQYSPTIDDQKKMHADEGVVGDLIIEYSVNNENKIGLFQAEQGYFTHYFSPPNLNPLGKNIVFVIDISGSMNGAKIKQTREAMLTILAQLREGDQFKIILFHEDLEYWPHNSNEMRPVTPGSISDAKDFVNEKIVSGGGTNLNAALVKGCDVLNELAVEKGNMIVFLTDGQPSSGVVDKKQIMSNVRDELKSSITIHSLGFGFDLDFELLKKVSWMTDGYAQRIYEGEDARKQLEDFYSKIGDPVLYDVRIEYDTNAIDSNSITNSVFSQYYQGSELMVVGRLKDDIPDEFEISINAFSETPISFAETLSTSTIIINPNGLTEEASNAMPRNYMEKLYVYMRIKELHKREMIEPDEDKAKQYHKEALQLALDYKLVTPLTSMIITERDPQPDRYQAESGAVPVAGRTPLAKVPIMTYDQNDVSFKMSAKNMAGASSTLQAPTLYYFIAYFCVCIGYVKRHS